MQCRWWKWSGKLIFFVFCWLSNLIVTIFQLRQTLIHQLEIFPNWWVIKTLNFNLLSKTSPYLMTKNFLTRHLLLKRGRYFQFLLKLTSAHPCCSLYEAWFRSTPTLFCWHLMLFMDFFCYLFLISLLRAVFIKKRFFMTFYFFLRESICFYN